MKLLEIYFYPKYLKNHIDIIKSYNSIRELILNPFNWIKNYQKIFKILLKNVILYFFKNPKIKWIDYNIEGYLNFKQAYALYNVAKKLTDKSTIVEIGSYLGRSTCFISEAIKKKKINFYTIDTFENQGMDEGLRDTYQDFYKNIFPYRKYINIIKGFSYDVVKSFQNRRIDMLWIDGDHSYKGCKKDIEDWYHLISKDGLILFHDYYEKSGNIKVKKAVDEKFIERKLRRIRLVGHLIITQKIS